MSALPAFLTKLAPAELAHLVDETHRQKGGLTILDLMKRFEAMFSPAEDWQAWRAFLAALFGLPMTEQEAAIYRACTGRLNPPTQRFREAYLIVGRRGGKSRISALIAIFLAAYKDYSKLLSPGERGTVPVLARDRKEARTIFGYIEGFIESDPGLAKMVEAKTKESISLSNRTVIEVHTANYKAVRSYTVVGALCDEIAFWSSEDSANPDKEIIGALKPGMMTVPSAILIGLSSPYARRGVLFDAYDKHYGKDDSTVLVWKADTITMHRSVDRSIIRDAYEDDPLAAAAEYGAEFRKDVESFVSREAVTAAVVPGRRELEPMEGWPYFAFADPSGGAVDSMTACVAHHKGGKYILDAVYEKRAPFQPEEPVSEIAALLKRYGLFRVTGDGYAGEWPRDMFRKHGVAYVVSDQSKSEIYQSVLPLLNNGAVELLDHPRMVKQLLGLDRKTARGGRESIDHPPGSQDDVINSAAGALVQAARIGQHIAPVVDQRQLSPMETRKLEYQEAVRRALGGEESDRSERYQEMGW